MYELFRDKPTRLLGQTLYPDIYYIRRTYKELNLYVKNFYRRNPKAVHSSNLIANLIQHFHVDPDSSDLEIINNATNYGVAIARNFGLTSSMFRGKVFDKGITLGPECDELAIASFEGLSKDYNSKSRWVDLVSVKYLYHTRTDLNMPIMNNTTKGKGYGVIIINIPLLILQYAKWLQWQKRIGVEQYENAYRFVGSVVLPNLIDSYLDIAYFNRLSRQLQGIKNHKYPLAHPFYLTDLSTRVDRLIEHVNLEATKKGIEVEGLAWITPTLLGDNLFNTMSLPREPLSYQNEWVMTLARFPYIKYLILALIKNPGYDRAQLNEVMIELINATTDRIFKTMGNTDFIKRFNLEVQDLIKLLKKRV